MYGSTKAGYTTARTRAITGKDLDKAWATISKEKQAELVSKAPDATKTAYSKYRFHNLPEKMKKDLLKKGGLDF